MTGVEYDLTLWLLDLLIAVNLTLFFSVGASIAIRRWKTRREKKSERAYDGFPRPV